MKHATCDRCKRPIPQNDLATDILSREYPDRDICGKCDGEIKLAGVIASKAALEGMTQQEYLKDWAANYGIQVK